MQAEQELLWQSAINSIRRAAQGFIISIIVATPIGLALGFYPKLRAIFGPILTGLQQLPSVAWVPAAIIWFGLSDATIFTVVLLGAVPSIANGLLAGMDQIPPIYLRAGQVMGAKGFGRTLAHRPARCMAGLPRRARAGLGLRLALPHGGRARSPSPRPSGPASVRCSTPAALSATWPSSSEPSP